MLAILNIEIAVMAKVFFAARSRRCCLYKRGKEFAWSVIRFRDTARYWY